MFRRNIKAFCIALSFPLTACLPLVCPAQEQNNQGLTNAQQSILGLLQSQRAEREAELEETRRISEIKRLYDPLNGETPRIKALRQRVEDIQIAIEQANGQIRRGEAVSSNAAYLNQSSSFLQTLAGFQLLTHQLLADSNKTRIQHLRVQLDEAERQLAQATNDYKVDKDLLAVAQEVLDKKDWVGAEAQFRKLIAREENNPDYRRGLALALERQKGREVEVIAQYRFAIKAKPDDDNAHHELGRFLRRIKKYGDASDSLREAIRLNQSNALYRVALANIYGDIAQPDGGGNAEQPNITDRQILTNAHAHEADYRNAFDLLDQAVQLDPGNVQASLERQSFGQMIEKIFRYGIAEESTKAVNYSFLGKSLLAQAKFAEAVPFLQKAFEMAPSIKDYGIDLSVALEGTSNLSKAAKILENLSARFSTDRDVLNRLALVLYQDKRFVEALDAYYKIPNVASIPVLSNSFRQICAAAIPQLESEVEKNPMSAPAQYKLALAFYDLREYPQSIGPIKQASLLEPKDALYRLGYGLSELRRSPKYAIPVLKEAVRLAPDRADFHYSLGIALYGDKSWGDAEKEFREAIRLSPDVAGYHNMAGLCLFNRSDYKKAEKDFREAVRLAGSNGTYLINLGDNLHEIAQHSHEKKREDLYIESQKYLRQALKLYPENGEYHAKLASILYDFSYKQEASDEAELAIRLGFEEDWVYRLVGKPDESKGRGKKGKK